MAVIKVVNSKASIGKAINYVTKGEKTEEKLISGKDCNPHTAIDEMKATKEQWGKTEGRQYKHYIQSFNPEDRITPEKAHEIGRKFVENTEKFKGHEVVISTHVDKGHIHNHFIVNTVNFENGKKFQQSKQDLEKLKEHSDRICTREGLSIIKEKGKEITSFDQKKYRAIEKGFTGKEKSYLLDTAKEVSQSLKKVTDRESFIKDMESKGYEVNWKDTRKNITFTTPEGQKIRSSNLEKTFKEQKFSKEGMENEFQRNRERSESVREEGREQGTDRADERNKRTQQAHAELHKGTHERGHNETNYSRRGTEQDKNNQSRDTRQNDFDFEKARNHAEQLRRETVSAYGKWKDSNEQEQSRGIDSNERDRGNSKEQHERNGKEDGKQLKELRTKDFEFTR